MFEECSQAHDVAFGDDLFRARSWISMILMGPFQLYSVIPLGTVRRTAQ